MTNIEISKSYPAVLYNASEAIADYHEDHEINGTFWHAINATYDEAPPGLWKSIDHTQPSYATVQNPDASTSYFTMAPTAGTWPTWDGSDNHTVYNAVDYGLVAGTVTQAQRAANVAAIQNAINAAIAAIGDTEIGGGTVVIPAGTYELGGTSGPEGLTANIDISGVTGGLTIRGESAGTTLWQYGTPQTTGPNLAADIFHITSSGSPGQMGLRFRELTLKYDTGLALPTDGAVAINCYSGVAYTTAENCGFYNCPQAFAGGAVGTMAGLQCGLVHCTVYQDLDGYSGSTQVLLSGPEAFVLYSELYQKPMIHGGPTGCTGISVFNSAEACRIVGCHISDFYTGIAVTQGSTFINITNCEVAAAAGLTIGPSPSGAIYGVSVTACKFGMIMSYMPPTPTSGILIDTGDEANTSVEGIFITDCLVYGFQNAGLAIAGGQSIAVVGGKYSSNGQAPLLPSQGAGIAIIVAPAQVRIVGVDCSGVFDFWSGTTQPYGITVAEGTDLSINGCDLTNNATEALSVATDGTDLRVTACLGYNDQNTVVSTTAPASGASFNGGTYGYYGPILFCTTSSAGATVNGITLQGTATNLTSGSFTLPPGTVPDASIIYHVNTPDGTPSFVLVGQ